MKPLLFISLFSLTSLLLTGCGRLITSGDHILQSGATEPGNLIITSGKVALEKGSQVSGSVFMTSGDLIADGEIQGDILLASGQVYLGPDAIVHGRIKGASGAVQQAEGAQVIGDVSTRVGGTDFVKFFVLAGIALYFLITTGRRPAIREKQPVAWAEKGSEKSNTI